MEKVNKKKSSFESIRIEIASPEKIKNWAKRKLPNGKFIGEVKNSQTVNYKTLRPEKDGLFCEKIFGPITDFECVCGKKQIFLNQKFCPECDVEFTSSKTRRYRLGYINLLRPVTHVWYLRGRPNYLSILLNMPKKKLEAMSYCTDLLTNIFCDFKFSRTERKREYTMIYSKYKKILFKLSENYTTEFFYPFSKKTTSWELSISGEWEWFCFARFFSFLPIPSNKKDIFIFLYKNKLFSLKTPEAQKKNRGDFGAEGIRKLLIDLNLSLLEKELRNQLFCLYDDIKDLQKEFSKFLKRGYILSSKERKDLKKFFVRELKKLFKIKSKKLRRFKIIKQFRYTKTRPEWLLLKILPVLPPDLRPIIQLNGDQVAVSDLNKFYQKIIYRNKRFEWLSSKNIYEYLGLFQYEQRLFQEAVDALIDNGKNKSDPITAPNERPLKSLSDILKGKKGRFRQNLLGKRVDYSGRSVIVVDPTLKLHQCGLPKEMAMELFQPFLIKIVMKKKKIRTIAGAKRILQKRNSFVLKLLNEIMKNHPVLLNRAPTLHRMGFQAFQSKLIEGRAILLHPLVCTAYNADFDGDQMGVHIPLSFEARAEAWTLLWSRNNLLSPATGQPSILPSQDMILGSFFLTTNNNFWNSQRLQKKIKISDSAALLMPSASNNSKSYCFSNFNQAINFYILENKSIHSTLWLKWNLKLETLKEKEKILELQIKKNGIYFFNFFEFEQIFLDNLAIPSSQARVKNNFNFSTSTASRQSPPQQNVASTKSSKVEADSDNKTQVRPAESGEHLGWRLNPWGLCQSNSPPGKQPNTVFESGCFPEEFVTNEARTIFWQNKNLNSYFVQKKLVQKQKKIRTTFGRIFFNQLINENLIDNTKESYDQSFFKPSF